MAARLRTIISGGQTGVDRAALDVAIEHGIACGGWCPRGRRADDGVIDSRYPLRETPAKRYAQRTEWNVRDSDGTLILASRPLRGGTALTRQIARAQGKPCLVIEDSGDAAAAGTIIDWLREHKIRTLNVAGPRESQSPGAYAAARDLLERCFTHARSAT